MVGIHGIGEAHLIDTPKYSLFSCKSKVALPGQGHLAIHNRFQFLGHRQYFGEQTLKEDI